MLEVVWLSDLQHYTMTKYTQILKGSYLSIKSFADFLRFYSDVSMWVVRKADRKQMTS